MRHGSLFSGIGGFDLAAEWMGWENVFHCEIDKFCQKVLKKNFPGVELYEDIKTTDFTKCSVDILTGGFPCQPYSLAGKRKGKEDDRHLWPEMLRAIREIQPRWVVGENVFGIVNWSGGLVFDEVQADLENEGYEVTPYILPACAKNAPHRRDRVWFVAYASSIQWSTTRQKEQQCRNGWKSRSDVSGIITQGITTNTKCLGQQRQRGAEEQECTKESGDWKTSWAYDDGRWPTQPPVCGRNNGISNRVDRIKALGNAVVPQVVYEIFKAIEKHERIGQ